MSSEKNNSPINISLTQIPDSIDKTAEGLLVKPAQTIGETISDLFKLVFGVISFNAEKQKIRYAAKLEAYKRKVEQGINSIPPDKVAEPDLQVVGQALENSKFCIESDELTTMFSKLITSAMNTDVNNCVHPSFPEILKQMAPQDAYLLLDFKNKLQLPVCSYSVKLSSGGYVNPFETIYLNDSHSHSAPEYYCNSLYSLKRLGLIDIDFINHFVDEHKYDIYKNHPLNLQLKRTYGESNVTIKKGITRLTPLGESFIQACVPDHFD